MTARGRRPDFKSKRQRAAMAAYGAEKRFWMGAEVHLEPNPDNPSILVFRVESPGRCPRRFGSSDLKHPFPRPFRAAAVRRALEVEVEPHLVRLRARARRLEAGYHTVIRMGVSLRGP